MRYLYITVYAILVLSLSACERTAETVVTDSAKIINTPEDADPSSILLKIKKNTAVSDLEEFLESAGTVSCEPVFDNNPLTADRMAEYGLDRWYKVILSEGTALESSAKILASADVVETVEFNTLYHKASDARSYPYSEAAASLMTPSNSDFNDPMFSSQWDFRNAGDRVVTTTAKAGADINVVPAWELCTGDKDVIVAVIDEGVQYDHPDLQANMWVNSGEIPGNGIDDDGNGYVDDVHGYNFAGNNGKVEWSAYGDTGHGTHCAGVISAVNGNGTGICGIAGGDGSGNGVRLMSCQIMQGWQGSASDVTAKAIRYAADNGAHIIQCSWGFNSGTVRNDRAFETGSSSSLTASALRYFLDKPNDLLDGGIAVFAAGNESGSMSSYPAAYRDCISVTSIAADGLPAYYTNYGPGCNIIAPGGEYCTGGEALDHSACLILSTMPTVQLPDVNPNTGADLGTKSSPYYGYMQGTSMACPHVSGIAALGLSYMKKLGKTMTRDQFISLLLTSVTDINSNFGGIKISYDGRNIGPVNLDHFRGNMGTGLVDTWRFLMNIEGTPSISVPTGVEQAIELKEYFGGDASMLTYTSVEVSDDAMKALGLNDRPYIKYGKLYILPTLTGSAKITVKAIGGGTSIGGGSNIGGKEIVREVSIISRPGAPSNGGWL